MAAQSDKGVRRALTPLPSGPDFGGFPSAGAAHFFTRGFLNANLLQLAICAPPRQAATRRYEQVYMTEVGKTPPLRAEQQAAAETVAR